MEAKSKGSMDIIVRSSVKTSTANMMAAIGDWNMEEIAPAEAHATKRDLVLASIWNNWLKLELSAEPDFTAGPNSPTDPPKPTVKGAAIKGV